MSSRKLAPWSLGPAIVSCHMFSQVTDTKDIKDFFHGLEKRGIHGTFTKEVVSEQVTHNRIISEIQYRSMELNYISKALFCSYKNAKASSPKFWGVIIKTWSGLVALSFLRKMAALSLVALYILNPTRMVFVNTTYLCSAVLIVAAVLSGSYMAGDRRNITNRIKETFFDLEAFVYRAYKILLTNGLDGSKSIVKKLPAISTLLIAADLILSFRAYSQYQIRDKLMLNNFQITFSLLCAYFLVVTLLIALGMVVIRQTRSSKRREVSRGANINSEVVSMIDLSPGGAGCESVTPFENNLKVEFSSSFPIVDGIQNFECLAVVRSCIEWNGSYRIGLEFLELHQKQKDALETYCSIIYPHAQNRLNSKSDATILGSLRESDYGRAEKRFLSYVASFVALGAVVFASLPIF